MANNFSSDSRFVAQWRFEDDYVDAIGNNDLTAYGSPVFSTDCVEGSKSLDLENGSSQYASIADSALDSGFPFKNGTSNKKATFFFRVKFESLTIASQGILAKRSGSTITFSIEARSTDGDDWLFLWGYNGGSESWIFEYDSMPGSVWQHFAFVVDGDAKKVTVFWFDDSLNLKTTKDKIFTNALLLADVPFYVGQNGNSAYLDAKVDDVIVANECLGQSEIERVIKQLYSGSGPKGAAAHSVLLEVLFEEPAEGTFIYSDANIPVTVNPAADGYDPVYVYAGNIPAAVNTEADSYAYQSPNTYVYTNANIPVSVDPTAELTQRVPHCLGNVPVSVDSTAAGYFSAVRIYQGDIPVTVDPACAYRVPIVGWDKYTGYGIVDIADLSTEPPFVVCYPDIPVVINPTAKDYKLYAEYEEMPEGGVTVGDEFEFDFFDPVEADYEIQPGVVVGLSPVFDFEGFPPTAEEVYPISLELEGGAYVWGFPEIEVTTPEETGLVEFELKGGVRLAGAENFEFFGWYDPTEEGDTWILDLDGGVIIGGFRRLWEDIVFSDPATDPGLTYEFSTEGSVYVEGEFVFDFYPDPVTTLFEINRLGVKSAPTLEMGFVEPHIVEFETQGGVVIEGVGIFEVEEIFETWALTGFGFNPSMYSGFAFNSYAAQNGNVFAANDQGIFLLGGTDDNGAAIHPGLRIGPANFGLDNYKRIRAVYPGDAGMPELKVTAATKGTEAWFPLERERFPVSVEVQDRLMTMEVDGFDELSHFEIIPVITAKR